MKVSATATEEMRPPQPAVPRLLSVNIGMPKDVTWQGKTVRTGIWKHSAQGPQLVRRLNVEGDGQGDLLGHGGEQRAVLVYQIDSYRYWEWHLGRRAFSFGEFGENFTVEGLPDSEVCIGDRYRIGEAEFEVTQPRVTCYRVGLRLGEPELPALLVSHHRPGFYMRVIREGHVQAGDEIAKTVAGPGALSVADVDALLYLPDRDPAKLRRALGIPALSPGWQRSFRELLLNAESDMAITAEVSPSPAWKGFCSLRVLDVVPETVAVSSIYLAALDDSPLPSARAGQYVTLRIADAGSPVLVRNYSLSSAPDRGIYRISVKREPEGVVSRYLHLLKRGSTLEVAAPRGTFVLDDADTPILFVSAGIGITPVLSMLDELAAARSERDIWWIHGAREPRQHAFAAEAHALLASLPSAHEHVFYSGAMPERQRSGHTDSGRITKAGLLRLGFPLDSSVYLCGPAAFMAEVGAALVSLGVEAGHIHTELFGALAAIRPGLVDPEHPEPHQPPGPPASGPLVTFARSGLTTAFGPERRSVLELAEACDLSTRWACRTGVCHTCMTSLLSGDVDYQPEPLERPSSDHVLICCAKPTKDIVLDM